MGSQTCNDNDRIVPVILCGGSGARLWPLSRPDRPKQFLQLLGKQSLLRQTIVRARAVESRQPMIVTTNRSHHGLVLDDLEQTGIDGTEILIEPDERNTAPALAVAAEYAIRRDPGALLLAMPADHYFEDAGHFADAVRRGVESAHKGAIVVFGIKPTRPHSGYGYIGKGRSLGKGVFQVQKFHEKPDLETARDYVNSGQHFWNSGVFLMRADTCLNELHRHAPDIVECTRRAVDNGHQEGNALYLGEDFIECRSDSIDYAVMEKVNGAVMVSIDVAWSDLGSWQNIREIEADGDTNGNVSRGSVLLFDTECSFIHSSSKLIVAAGLRNQLIVDTPDVLLVASLDKADDMKAVVNALRKLGRPEVDRHSCNYHSWGWQESLLSQAEWQIERIHLNPCAGMPQGHAGAGACWLVAHGDVILEQDGIRSTIIADEPCFVRPGSVYRLLNESGMEIEVFRIEGRDRVAGQAGEQAVLSSAQN